MTKTWKENSLLEVLPISSWMPLRDALAFLDQKHNVKLHQANLTARKGRGKESSIMDELEAEGTARRVARGSRQYWEVSDQGVARLACIAASARPGPPPGNQVTLDAHQLKVFVLYLAQHPEPADVVGEALRMATGLSEGVDRVVIPISPRRPVSPGRDTSPVS